MLAVIGSVAMNIRLGDVRKENDLDIVGTYEAIQEFVQKMKFYGENILANYPIDAGKKILIKTETRIIEAEIAWPNSNSEKLLNLTNERPKVGSFGNTLSMFDTTFVVPSLDVLYMLKMSHRYLKDSPHFLKTMQDIQLMRKAEAKIRPEHEEFYKERQAIQYAYGHPKLNQSKKDFFSDSVPYKYDHDSIHEAVALGNRPAYTEYMKDGSEVMVDREKWDKLDTFTKLCGVIEESYVLALERSQIPFPKMDRKKSFDIALMKVCTSITSGWFREFAWENYDQVQAMYNQHYVDWFYKALHEGKIKPFKGEMK